jgi:predicted N-acetyltransferase YhbS
MNSSNLQIRLEQAIDEPVLSALSAQAFGPGRFARSAYRIREGIPPVASLCFTALLDARLVGGIRFTAIEIGGQRGALLLGPLVVDPAHVGQGIGKALIETGLARASEQGFALVLLVGDMPYYCRFGFKPAPLGQITFPGPVEPARLLEHELVPLALGGMQGAVQGVRPSGPRGTR